MKLNIDDLKIIMDALEDEIIIQRAAELTHSGDRKVLEKNKLDKVTKVYAKIAIICKDYL